MNEVFQTHFLNSWNQIKQAIDNVSNEIWQLYENDWAFVETVYHIIETAEFYTRDVPDGMEWGKNAGINWKEETVERARTKFKSLSKDFLYSYLTETENKVEKFFQTHEKLLIKDNWADYFPSTLDRLLYLLRHNHHHIGELNRVLRYYKSKRINWE
jgi:hypothetical protein